MKLFDKVRTKRKLDSVFNEGPVESGAEGYIVEIFENPKGFCVEFGVDIDECVIADCKEEDLELVTE